TEARASYETALRLSPNDPSALVGLGIVEYEAGNFARAANDYYRAMLQQPTDVGYLLMSRALNRAGQQAPAQAARAQAEQISKDLAQAQESADRLLAP
ncbi:MAG: tetratricopeptide repeat protein, partial [Acidobacteriales bacterium]|nr:tetratricopeptide repeat protein [Terriglobales bacterium]